MVQLDEPLSFIRSSYLPTREWDWKETTRATASAMKGAEGVRKCRTRADAGVYVLDSPNINPSMTQLSVKN